MVKIHYGNDLVALSSSILKRFNIEPHYMTLKEADELFRRNKDKKVVLFLFDGMGRVIYETYKDDIPFIYSHIYHPFYSIYPPTTVAATTALLTAKYPLENGFVGWNQYFKHHNDFIDVFLSSSKTKKYPNITSSILKPDYISDIINQKYNEEKMIRISSFDKKLEDGTNDFDYFFSRVNDEIRNHEFIYAYMTEPDHSMHQFGIKNSHVKDKMIYLNKKMEEIVTSNPDVLFLLISDHGFVDMENIDIRLDKELMDTLKPIHDKKRSYYTIEGRFASFFVKDKEKFKEIYQKRYSNDFILLTKEELLKSEILGPISIKDYKKEALETIGDFILLAKSKYNFKDKDEFQLLGGHAGVTPQEMEIYLTVFNDF